MPSKEEPKTDSLLNNLDLLSSTLLEQSLPQDKPRLGSQFKPQEKISLNQMKQKSVYNPSQHSSKSVSKPTTTTAENINSHLNSMINSNSSLIDNHNKMENVDSLVDNLGKTLDLSNVEKLSDNTENLNNSSTLIVDDVCKKKITSEPQLCEVKPMADLNITLQDITPGKILSDVFLFRLEVASLKKRH